MPDPMRDQVKCLADSNRRSLNNELLELLERALAQTFPSSTPLLEFTSPEEVRQLDEVEAPPNTLAEPRAAYLKVIDRAGKREITRGYQIIPMSDLERRWLDVYRRLSPSKQLAILSLFEE